MARTSTGSRAGGPPAREPVLPGAAPVSSGPPELTPRARAAARLVLTEPFTRRARMDLAFWALELPVSVLGFAAILVLAAPGFALTGSLVGAFAGLMLLATATRAARALASVHRRIARQTLGATVGGPAQFLINRGILVRMDARLRDGAGWRAVAYLLLQLPMAFIGLYFALAPWIGGLFYLTYPFWWLVLPRPLETGPFFGGGIVITTFPGALLLALLGVPVLLLAPWTTRLPIMVDVWLMRHLIGNTGQSERIRELEASRARAVDDSAAMLRRVERNLHDGAQARLVALAMHLGRAREQLGADGEPPDVARARDLLAAAHDGAKEALTELRDLARGIHPPALDGGLADALASLTAASATPVRLSADISVRPTPAIETIAYFCAAELLANVAKHSRAGQAAVEVTGQDGTLRLTVTDDGDGGARSRPGGGLDGLEQRVATVDGALAIISPAGGPTEVTITLPLRA